MGRKRSAILMGPCEKMERRLGPLNCDVRSGLVTPSRSTAWGKPIEPKLPNPEAERLPLPN